MRSRLLEHKEKVDTGNSKKKNYNNMIRGNRKKNAKKVMSTRDLKMGNGNSKAKETLRIN